MPAFNEALAMALATEGLTFPEGFGEGLMAAYEADIAEANDLAGAKIADLERLNGEANTLASGLKIQLFDLMSQQTASDALADTIPDEARETYDDPDEQEEAASANFDSMFTEDEEDNK